MPTNYHANARGPGYSPDYGQTPPDYDEVGINSVDEALGRIARSVKNRFVYGPGIEPPPDVGMYNAPKPPPAPGPVEEEDNIVVQPRPELPARPSMPNPTNIGAASQPAGMQGPTPSSIRAIRLPNGHMLFTDRSASEIGGDELSQGQAGEAVQRQTRNINFDPTSRAMSALVAASMRASRIDQAGPPPEPTVQNVSGPAWDSRPGFSAMQGTDEQKRGLELEKAAGLAAMAKAGAETAEAERRTREAPMTPEERTTAESPQIAINRDAERRSFELQQANWRSSADHKRAVQTPGDPRFIADPNMQAVEIKKIEDARIAMDQEISDRYFASLHINPPAPAEYRR